MILVRIVAKVKQKHFLQTAVHKRVSMMISSIKDSLQGLQRGSYIHLKQRIKRYLQLVLRHQPPHPN